jgi:hypothetical protein
VGGVAKLQERISNTYFVGQCDELLAMESNLAIQYLILVALSLG